MTYLNYIPGKPTIDFDQRYSGPQFVRAGATLTLPISYQAYPKPTVEWLYNDVPLTHSTKVNIETINGNSTLYVKSMTKDDEGMYCVKVTNKAGTSLARFDVSVKGKLLDRLSLIFVILYSSLFSYQSLSKE